MTPSETPLRGKMQGWSLAEVHQRQLVTVNREEVELVLVAGNAVSTQRVNLCSLWCGTMNAASTSHAWSRKKQGLEKAMQVGLLIFISFQVNPSLPRI